MNHSRQFPGTSLKWTAPSRSYLPEVRIIGGETRSWERVPVGTTVEDSPYSATVFGTSDVFTEWWGFRGSSLLSGRVRQSSVA